MCGLVRGEEEEEEGWREGGEVTKDDRYTCFSGERERKGGRWRIRTKLELYIVNTSHRDVYGKKTH